MWIFSFLLLTDLSVDTNQSPQVPFKPTTLHLQLEPNCTENRINFMVGWDSNPQYQEVVPLTT